MKEIPLTQGKVAVVDDADYDMLSRWKWAAAYDPTAHTFYAVRTVHCGKQSTTVRMHRIIAGATDNELVDHINHDTLDNRRTNLRRCDSVRSAQNRRRHTDSRGKYKGVHMEAGRYRARICVRGKYVHLGNYLSEEEAARAFDVAARVTHGEFAYLNFPDAMP